MRVFVNAIGLGAVLAFAAYIWFVQLQAKSACEAQGPDHLFVRTADFALIPYTCIKR